MTAAESGGGGGGGAVAAAAAPPFPTPPGAPRGGVDAGANAGRSLDAWRGAYGVPRIYAVEGSPDTADRLATALAKGGMADADVAGGGGRGGRGVGGGGGPPAGGGGVTPLRSLVGNTTREATFRRSRAAADSPRSGQWPDGAPQWDGLTFDCIARGGDCGGRGVGVRCAPWTRAQYAGCLLGGGGECV